MLEEIPWIWEVPLLTKASSHYKRKWLMYQGHEIEKLDK
jgi:hypothetical protein